MIWRRLEGLIKWVVAGLFLFFVTITFMQVVLRYGFSASLAGIDELSRYSFIWLVFLAGAVVCRNGQHIALVFIDEIVPRAARRVLIVLSDLAMIAFALIVGLGGWALMQLNWTERSPANGIPIAWVQAVLPLFGILCTLFCIVHAWRAWTGADAEPGEDA